MDFSPAILVHPLFSARTGQKTYEKCAKRQPARAQAIFCVENRFETLLTEMCLNRRYRCSIGVYVSRVACSLNCQRWKIRQSTFLGSAVPSVCDQASALGLMPWPLAGATYVQGTTCLPRRHVHKPFLRLKPETRL